MEANPEGVGANGQIALAELGLTRVSRVGRSQVEADSMGGKSLSNQNPAAEEHAQSAEAAEVNGYNSNRGIC